MTSASEYLRWQTNEQYKKTYLYSCNYDRTPPSPPIFNVLFQYDVKCALPRVFFLSKWTEQKPFPKVKCVQFSTPGVNIYFHQVWTDLLHSSIFIKFLSAHSSKDVSLCLAMFCGDKTVSERIKENKGGDVTLWRPNPSNHQSALYCNYLDFKNI